MARIPAHCRNCDEVFPSLFEAKGNNSGISFQNCMSTCPHCGGKADVIPGTYNITDEFVELISGSTLSFQRVQKYHKLLLLAKQANYHSSEVYGLLNSEAPELVPMLHKLVERVEQESSPKTNPPSHWQDKTFEIALALLILFLSYQFSSSSPSQIEVEQMIEEKINTYRSEEFLRSYKPK